MHLVNYSIAIVAILVHFLPGHCVGQTAGSAVGDTLTGLFNPGSAADAKTMGLIQRSNYIDRVAGKRGRIEIALVVDATDSMEAELKGIQERLLAMLDDIRRVAGDEVFVQIVLYRDQGAVSGVVSWPLVGKQFTRDPNAIRKGLERLLPESGAPYFLEAVDQGLYAAITELPWTQDEQTTKWLFLIGDAPPFDRGFNEPETGAQRKHSTEQLIQLAQDRGIAINAILCPTRTQDQEIYDEIVGSTRFFFGQLTSQTAGWMIDLSDPLLLENVTSGARKAVSDFIKIDPITRAELEEVRSAADHDQAAIAPSRRVRIAVLPHLTLEQMVFSRRNPAVRFADEMRSQLETIGLDVDVVGNHELERTFFRIETKGMQRETALQQIGMGVGADYVFWGTMDAGQPDKVQSGILDTTSGRFVVTIPSIDTQFPARASLSSTVLDALAQASKRVGSPIQLARVQRKFRTRLVADTEAVERLTLSARGTIQDAMQLMMGEGNSEQLFADAERDLEEAIKLDSDNPIINSLLANVYFSQFQMAQASGDNGAAGKRRSANRFAGEAKKNVNRVLEMDQLEINADFHFYRSNFAQAAQLYEQMIQRGDTLGHVRRARWMLIGIYSGDWGIAQALPELVDARKARVQIVQLLAFFEDSPNARLLRKHLVWDEARGGTLNPNLPRTRGQ